MGSVSLFSGGTRLLLAARELEPLLSWHWLAPCIGALAGFLKAFYLFVPSIKRNLARIDALPSPKPWQFFRPAFFGWLAVMIGTGIGLSLVARGSYPLLITVSTLDYSIAVALLGSSLVFVGRA